MSDDVELDDYKRALISLQISYSEVELWLIPALRKWTPDYPYIPRLPLLQRDLAQLGIQGLPLREPDKGDVADQAYALGALYVIEGSTLGGKILIRHLQSRLGAVISGSTAFYELDGKLDSPHWASTLVLLRENLNTPANIESALLSARQTFMCFHTSALATAPL
jgi:heme oxygenase